MSNLIENIDYTVEEGRVIFTALFHIKRGQCCGNGCRNCPYEANYTKGSTIIKEKFATLKEKLYFDSN